MKYLYAIILHLFPRRQWTTIHTIEVFERPTDTFPCKRVFVQRDQFGNLRNHRTQ